MFLPSYQDRQNTFPSTRPPTPAAENADSVSVCICDVSYLCSYLAQRELSAELLITESENTQNAV